MNFAGQKRLQSFFLKLYLRFRIVQTGEVMPTKVPKVVVIGSTYVDMSVRCDEVPVAGQNLNGTDLSYTATGFGPNQAVQAANCGCEVSLISKVGGDCFAEMVTDILKSYGIKTEYVFVSEPKNTGTTVTLVNSEGENAVVTYNGANCALSPGDIRSSEGVISQADMCLIHGRLPEETIIEAIKTAKIHGVKVVLNPAMPIKAGTEAETTILPGEYFHVDVMVANLYEATSITDHNDFMNARGETAKLIGSDLVARGVGKAVITMGRRGCMVVDRKVAEHIPAFTIELVDQTARGDAFAGALASYCAVKDDIVEAARFASAAGALACTKFGTMDAMPMKSEILELLLKQDLG